MTYFIISNAKVDFGFLPLSSTHIKHIPMLEKTSIKWSRIKYKYFNLIVLSLLIVVKQYTHIYPDIISFF